MPTYTYKIVNKQNKIVEGSLRAFTQAKAQHILSREGANILLLQRSPIRFLRMEISLPRFGFSKVEQIHFFRNLATMLSAGLSTADALRVLNEQASTSGVKKVIASMIAAIENGQKLSSTMQKHPAYFSEFLYETVHVGEVTGKLIDMLEHLANDLEHDYELARKVRGAMAYPFVVVAVMMVVVVGLTVYVLPKIADLFTEMNATLPLPTRVLLHASAFVRSHPFAIVGGLLLLCAALYGVWRSKRGRYILHYAALKAPIFGALVREFNLARFFRALESLFASGVSLVHSVETAKKTLTNVVYREALDKAHLILIHGAPLTQALDISPSLFPLQTRRIVEVGERTGKLEEIFMRITSYYERALRHKTQMLASLIEPVLILLIGVIVGGLAVSVFLPIYQLSNVL